MFSNGCVVSILQTRANLLLGRGSWMGLANCWNALIGSACESIS